jgi:glucosamine-6-phosphate deaminase
MRRDRLFPNVEDAVSQPQPIKQFIVDSLNVRVFPSQTELAADAAREAAATLSAAITAKGSAAAILATGNSQLRFLEALVKLGGVDWSKVTLFHMDEYLGISANHTASFRKYMRERVESLLKPKVFHYIEGDSAQPIAECERYARLLAAQAMDLCCLGIGENGHLAFNDPPVADFHDQKLVKIVTLDEACRRQQVGEGHFKRIEDMPQYAITLTIPALIQAERVLAIVPEKRKASAVKNSLKGPISTGCPGSYLRLQKHALLFLDQESASQV